MAWTPVLPDAEALAPVSAGTLLIPLTHLAVLQASGPDATAFLHGQLSHDLQGLAPGGSLLAGYCNAKGRLHAVLRVWRTGDDWQICLPADTADGVLKRLRMFVLRSKVTLVRREDVTLLGVAGNGAGDSLARAGLPVPGEVSAVATQGSAAVARLPGSPARFQLCIPDADAPALWKALADDASLTPPDSWRLMDIDAGQPAVYAQTLEAFVPQMVNLELIDGVSFRKGCYPGQEIVARMHYLGKPSRRMYRLQADGGLPLPGTAVLDAADREVGTVVDAQAAGARTSRLLAVLQVAASEGPLHLPGGAQLERLSLAYLVNENAADQT